MVKTIAIVQARMCSSRFPGKVMKLAAGKPLIQHTLDRLSMSTMIDTIVLATSQRPENDGMSKYVEQLGYDVFRGKETDVLDRYLCVAAEYNSEIIIRITGDCPLIDFQITDEVINFFVNNNFDYVSNGDPPTFPDGLDTEVFTFEALKRSCDETQNQRDREHVTTHMRESGLFKVGNYKSKIDLSGERWVVDYPEDYQLIKTIIEHFDKGDKWFGLEDILEFKRDKPDLFTINEKILRNDGLGVSSGISLWNRAKRVIPGGNMLLSKRVEMFLPEKWPAYFSKAHGCKVWDLDNNEFIDMSMMGVGTNILGYSHPEVDEAVRTVVQNGNMSTLNCPEEVYLAERLVQMHPWAEMARFARSGGEANAIAVRIGRAASGKDAVAICGYHGWHDWYLAANLGDQSSLDGHLLPGLKVKGVPRTLKDTTFVFDYNDFEQLSQLINQHDIGVVKMEVSRTIEPHHDFLESVRRLTIEKNIVLIFDECTSGFRETFGGLHKKYGVEPDIAVFGKALGNGYAITAIIGRREVMEETQNTFMSSTFWTERIGPVAGLKTLDVMEREYSWLRISETGLGIGERWKELARKYDLPFKLTGRPSLISFTMPVKNWQKYRTLITQEMLKAGFLASNIIYVSTSHSPDIVDAYFDRLDSTFSLIAQCENGAFIDDYLNGPVCHTGFKRLN